MDLDELYQQQREEEEARRRARQRAWEDLRHKHNTLAETLGGEDQLSASQKRQIKKEIADYNKEWGRLAVEAETKHSEQRLDVASGADRKGRAERMKQMIDEQKAIAEMAKKKKPKPKPKPKELTPREKRMADMLKNKDKITAKRKADKLKAAAKLKAAKKKATQKAAAKKKEAAKKTAAAKKPAVQKSGRTKTAVTPIKKSELTRPGSMRKARMAAMIAQQKAITAKSQSKGKTK